jgi:hypothetical protein
MEIILMLDFHLPAAMIAESATPAAASAVAPSILPECIV